MLLRLRLLDDLARNRLLQPLPSFVFQATGDERGPARLVNGAATAARVAIEEFVEPGESSPVGVVREPARFALPGRPTGGVRREERRQALGKVEGDFAQIFQLA